MRKKTETCQSLINSGKQSLSWHKSYWHKRHNESMRS